MLNESHLGDVWQESVQIRYLVCVWKRCGITAEFQDAASAVSSHGPLVHWALT